MQRLTRSEECGAGVTLGMTKARLKAKKKRIRILRGMIVVFTRQYLKKKRMAKEEVSR